ncbi:MAG TPA: polysaccharide biosynthesis/export family protein [Terriglobales bacterium]|nr:polysaccharide biosynthesis/export family protein [Terriglobales bacterium]
MSWASSFSSKRAAAGFLALLLGCALSSTLSGQETPANSNVQTQARAAGDDAQTQPSPAGNPPKSTPSSALHLGPGDLVDVNVYNVPELSTKTRISSSGDLYLPLIDYVHVGGLTIDEAQSVIEKRYADGGFVKDPHVTVFVDEYASQGATILGEVARPGVYPVLGQQRLFDLLSLAGGLSDKAGNQVVITHRNQPDHPETLALSRNVSEVPKSNVRIIPGDTVVVRQADIVYVVGDVQRPTGILMERGNITVMQAIALAGGTTKTSKLGGARIIHRGPSGMTEERVQLQKILEAKLPDVPMSPDDILFVPSSAFKGAIHGDVTTALQVASLSLVIAR